MLHQQWHIPSDSRAEASSLQQLHCLIFSHYQLIEHQYKEYVSVSRTRRHTTYTEQIPGAARLSWPLNMKITRPWMCSLVVFNMTGTPWISFGLVDAMVIQKIYQLYTVQFRIHTFILKYNVITVLNNSPGYRARESKYIVFTVKLLIKCSR